MSRKKKEAHVNHERWLVSYADFMTLLFALFVVLFASGQADKKKEQALGAAIASAFNQMGIFETHSEAPPVQPGASVASVEAQISAQGSAPEGVMPESTTSTDIGLAAQYRALHDQLRQMLAVQLKNGSISVRDTADGMVISLKEAGFFDSGSASVRPETLPVVAHIAAALAPEPFSVRIEGHTDNVPIHTAHFDSNWELSTARASAVTRIFLAQAHINPAAISAAGYAEYHPIAANDTAEGRAQNRRVDIIVLPRRAPSQSPASAADHQTPHRTPAATAPGPAVPSSPAK